MSVYERIESYDCGQTNIPLQTKTKQHGWHGYHHSLPYLLKKNTITNMKTTSIIKAFTLSIIAIAFCLHSQAQESQMTFCKTLLSDRKIHDFGNIEEKDGKKSHTFVLCNKGNIPVAITDISAFCGCTSVDYPKKPIAPGKTAKLTVSYNPANRPGKFSKEITLILNNGSMYTRVWVKGNVKSYRHPVEEDYPYDFGHGLHMGLKTISFSSTTTTVQQRLSNETGKKMIIKFRRRPNNRVMRMPEEVILQPWQRTTFNVSYKAPRKYDKNRKVDVMLTVNGEEASPMTVLFYCK